MTMQMEENRRYNPIEWVVIQKGEFEKEFQTRIALTYSDLSKLTSMSSEGPEYEHPAGVKRIPEHGPMMGISKGWQSKKYNVNPHPGHPVAHPKSEVPNLSLPMTPAGRPSNSQNVVEMTPPRVPSSVATVRPTNMMEQLPPCVPVNPSSPSQTRGSKSVSILSRTSSAPFGLPGRERDSSRTPKSLNSTGSSFFDRSMMSRTNSEVSYGGCRRTGSLFHID
eukprot:TRINITY_DN116978_c0_g1_i1.p1 TRINITY_DN116978_c0_g1~~TRINITY_DN116978_c0_g1_i1.p1  ORF type:complete len:222 (+),score=20.75 TRINITY_DN116978_c0_g1_i1:100-765(+)